MKKYYGSSRVREADRIASDELGIPGVVLMENAGRGAAEIMLRKYPEAKNFLILCGPGNNGGDGLVAARHLALAGRAPHVITTIEIEEYKKDAAFAAVSAQKLGLGVLCSKRMTDSELWSLISSSDVIVDALLGTGAGGVPRGEVKRLIELCGKAGPVVSLDIPSGVDPDTGMVAETAMSAELTLTFLVEKTGLAVSPGSLHSGEVIVCGIGVPPELLLKSPHELTGYDKSDIPNLSPKISKSVHKGRRGALMIVGGCDFFRGAPVLAAMGALKAGCGLVFLAVPDFIVASAAALLPEAMFIPLPRGEKDGSIGSDSFWESISPWLEKCDALVCGPGMGRSDDARKVARQLYLEWEKPLLLDADALRHAADMMTTSKFRRNPNTSVITPHAGEAAYLLGVGSDEISANRLSSCVELAKNFGVALLKGPHTLICGGANKRVILEGGPQLAIPGSGDVLAGVIGAFLAAGMPPIDAATLGALTHAAGGDVHRGANGLLAGELARYIPLTSDKLA